MRGERATLHVGEGVVREPGKKLEEWLTVNKIAEKVQQSAPDLDPRFSAWSYRWTPAGNIRLDLFRATATGPTEECMAIISPATLCGREETEVDKFLAETVAAMFRRFAPAAKEGR
jgi:hypothetical protein